MPDLVPISLNIDPLAPPLKVGALGVSAGFPSPAGDDLEDEIDPIGWVVRRPGSTFWYRAEGNCLLDVGIMDGDLIAFDRSGKKRPGRVMLFVVDGAFTLFDTPSTRSPKLMEALDAVNGRYGKKSLVIAREGFAGRTAMRQQFRSPRYTTRISDVPVIRG